MRVAVDAMGGDHAPEAVVEGAVLAASEYGIHVILVGDREILFHLLKRQKAKDLPVSIKHASEVVEMHDSPSVAVRRKRDSSIRVTFELVRTGEAVAAVSAGNSGAAMAVAMLSLRLLPGVERPAIAAILPTLNGPTVLLDVGANVDCKPIHLIQFGIMGDVFARHALRIPSPRVGILSNGEEETKGTDLTRAADEALRKSSLNYVGYVEGRDIFAGKTEVVVCDGFTGNVVLKASEGLAHAFGTMLKTELRVGLLSRLGYVLARGSFKRLKGRLDYAEVGGAPLLGVNGVGIISHGSSDARAIKNAIRAARSFAEERVNLHMMQSLEKNEDLEAWGSRKALRLWNQLKDKIIHRREEEGEG
ncbi:MAG: phosphate acyltransferase PlsX [Deltaproteobacteria bacterium]|nr:phosphate acyltransferase PlsX [Deltaproteobacteria bacterium]